MFKKLFLCLPLMVTVSLSMEQSHIPIKKGPQVASNAEENLLDKIREIHENDRVFRDRLNQARTNKKRSIQINPDLLSHFSPKYIRKQYPQLLPYSDEQILAARDQVRNELIKQSNAQAQNPIDQNLLPELLEHMRTLDEQVRYEASQLPTAKKGKEGLSQEMDPKMLRSKFRELSRYADAQILAARNAVIKEHEWRRDRLEYLETAVRQYVSDMERTQPYDRFIQDLRITMEISSTHPMSAESFKSLLIGLYSKIQAPAITNPHDLASFTDAEIDQVRKKIWAEVVADDEQFKTYELYLKKKKSYRDYTTFLKKLDFTGFSTQEQPLTLEPPMVYHYHKGPPSNPSGPLQGEKPHSDDEMKSPH